ncbi:CRM-domain containing factor CFM3, chloroplastic/mitochondrial-like [Aristolochia californica]|uniref:CRM-domain containing factor CFM3, chloroplastic/mitochondrial-like n=1 Tax=Aristolochia californica TaxID=171875 RepID=UPI0035DF3F94
MALSCTTKLSDVSSISLLPTPRKPLSSFKLFFSSSLRTSHPKSQKNPRSSRYTSDNQNPRNISGSSAPWLQKWPGHGKRPPESDSKIRKDDIPDISETPYLDRADRGRSAIERIVLRLRNLGLADDDDEVLREQPFDDLPWEGEEKLGDLLQRSWPRPDSAVLDDADELVLFPWERGVDGGNDEGRGFKRKRVKAPTLAELTIEDAELRRLRRAAIILRERITIPKAGVTQVVLEKIHNAWRKSELVRLKFHESLTHDMKTALEIVERRTGGLVIWRSGSVMVVYRGANYQRPSFKSLSAESTTMLPNLQNEEDAHFGPEGSGTDSLVSRNGNEAIFTAPKETKSFTLSSIPVENLTEEEKEYNSLLNGLGPRFVDWWGTGVLPVDADLLPPNVPGYKTPFRLLPTGMRSRLTNSEMTSLRKLARSLPSHFAIGRNRNHQGLAAAILKLWEKSTVVKIAVKQGIQNTNNELMAEELKKLTGGVLLLRNKYYIVIYRGKDFVPTKVAATLAERQEQTKDIQNMEEEARTGVVGLAPSAEINEEGQALAGTLAEFLEAQARWGKEISAKEIEKIKEEASRAEKAKKFKKIDHKLALAQAKKLRAEKLLAKIETSMIPAGPCDDQEAITDEERSMFRRVGLRMKAYLPLGIRGVFDGVIENMHLHWKHRELVKLITKQKTLSFVEDTARLLEYESGGILVAIERVPKGYALIYYRGKNYQRPVNLRPRNLLTKAKALKRSVAMQRHEALSQHISELESKIQEMKSDLEISDGTVDGENKIEHFLLSHSSESEEEKSWLESDDDDDIDESNIEDN